jgi:predicted aconitase
VAWAESSAVVFVNSVVGAYTNREGGPGALAAAIVGRTARYGYHLPESRLATHRVRVRAKLSSIADFGALGYLVGRDVRDGVPYFENLAEQLSPLPDDPSQGGDAIDRLKTMGAAMAASGSIALYHVAGMTPEAVEQGVSIVRTGAHVIEIESLREAYDFLDRDKDVDRIDLVSIGCPHASLAEVRMIADYLRGKHLKTRLWITTSRHVKEFARRLGLADIIAEAGGRIVADTCTVVAPIGALGIKTMATNAAKTAWYAPAHSGVKVRYGSLEQCLDAAVTGRWK